MTATLSSRHVRAMVDLLEAQAQEIQALQGAVRNLEGSLEVLVHLDAIVAGQLREPLEGIERSLGELGGRGGDPSWQAAVDEALAQVRALRGVVSELVKPQKIGPAPVERSRLVTVPLDGLVEQALTMASSSLDRGRVEVDLPPGFMITTAPRRLVCILVSLFENAACDGRGPIECRGAEGQGWIDIQVADRGQGLRDIDLESLFEPRQEGEDEIGGDRAHGMYLVRMLARSLGGEATVADRAGGGVVARLRLPQRRGVDVPSLAPDRSVHQHE
ncbi:MAG: HAMP domain-containing histidine kinase [Actinomycetota bacterium]|nr:HAMP domain-containing histidine kinase [Actinomycetota bacterium]